MPKRGEPDAELEAAVEAEYRASNQRALDLQAQGITAFATPRETIRKRLRAERTEAQAAELRALQIADLRGSASAGDDAATTVRPGRVPAPIPFGKVEQIQALHKQGMSQRKIAERVGLDRKTKVHKVVWYLDHHQLVLRDGEAIRLPDGAKRDHRGGLFLPMPPAG